MNHRRSPCKTRCPGMVLRLGVCVKSCLWNLCGNYWSNEVTTELPKLQSYGGAGAAGSRPIGSWLLDCDWVPRAPGTGGGLPYPKLPIILRPMWPGMASLSPCTFPGSMEGVTRRHLRYGMETPHGHAITKILEAADFRR